MGLQARKIGIKNGFTRKLENTVQGNSGAILFWKQNEWNETLKAQEGQMFQNKKVVEDKLCEGCKIIM